MERTKIVRGLQIAWSVWWGILCVLLVVLWVRSYSWIYSIHGTGYPREFWCESLRGELGFLVLSPNAGSVRGLRFWTRPPEQVPYYKDGLYVDWPRPFSTAYGIRWTFFRGFGLVIPCWMPVVFIGALASVPWIPWSCRFSLRTLLIATTLIAVALGLVVWSTTG
jgi:hypothetical protein